MSVHSIHCRHLIAGSYSPAIEWLFPSGCKELVPSTWTSNYNIKEELAKLYVSSFLVRALVWGRFLRSPFKATNSPVANKQFVASSRCSFVPNNYSIASKKCSLIKQSTTSSKCSIHSPLSACDFVGFNQSKVKSWASSGRLHSQLVISIISRQLSTKVLQQSSVVSQEG
ncbi:hypothetical protein Acr_00g0025120 [Actinidia rufa]|uniref:Uncharacterized protein n=1 Tax=Actinidia rufa TaxID=165716 RepID=A0A7J0DEL6_9ERIC|nr:hypothetical protein Acr_00g0025120 [Actinidia rufa]